MQFIQILIEGSTIYGVTSSGEIFFATLGNKRLASQWQLLQFKEI